MQNYSNPQTFNRYSYCSNNPLNRTDPTGKDYISDHGGRKVSSSPGYISDHGGAGVTIIICPTIQSSGIGLGFSNDTNLTLGQSVTFSDHVLTGKSSFEARGYTEDQVRSTIDNYFYKTSTTDRTQPNYEEGNAEAFYGSNNSGDYVIVNTSLKKVTAVGDKRDQNWEPDKDIDNPIPPGGFPPGQIPRSGSNPNYHGTSVNITIDPLMPNFNFQFPLNWPWYSPSFEPEIMPVW